MFILLRIYKNFICELCFENVVIKIKVNNNVMFLFFFLNGIIELVKWVYVVYIIVLYAFKIFE